MTSNPNRPSTGQNFIETSSGYTDLSALAPEFPYSDGASMGGGNMTTSGVSTGAPGSASEQTDLPGESHPVPTGDVMDFHAANRQV